MTTKEKFELFIHPANSTGIIPNLIYHYTDIKTTLDILSSQSVCLRMTNAEDFEDTFEGKTIEVYYDLALHNLKQSGLLDDRFYDILGKIDTYYSNRLFFQFFDQNGLYTKSAKYNAYVACFSTLKQDPFMIKNYIKHPDKKGYCIGLYSTNLRSNRTIYSTQNRGWFDFAKVLYGANIISMLESEIKLIYSHYSKLADEEITEYIVPYMTELLKSLKLKAKLSKYEKENEVRLILYTPIQEDISKNYGVYYTEERNERGKRFIDVKFPKTAFSDLLPTDSVDEKERAYTIEQLSHRGYLNG